MQLLDIINEFQIVPSEPNWHSGSVTIVRVNYPGKLSHWAISNGSGNSFLSQDILEFQFRPASGDTQQEWNDFRSNCYFKTPIDALNQFKRYCDGDTIKRNQYVKHYQTYFKYEEMLKLLKLAEGQKD